MMPVLLSLDSVGVDETGDCDIYTPTTCFTVCFFYLFLRCIGFLGARSDGWWSGRKRFHFTVFVYLFRRTGGQHVFLWREEKEAELRPVCRKNCNYEGYGLSSLAGGEVFWLVCLSAALLPGCVSGRNMCREDEDGQSWARFMLFSLPILLLLTWFGMGGRDRLLVGLLG